MVISLPENDWVKLRQVLMALEQNIATAGDGTGTGTGTDGLPGRPGSNGLNVWATYNSSDLTAMPVKPNASEGNTGAWHYTPASGDNWMCTKRSASAETGDWGTPFTIRGMPGHTVIPDCVFRLKLDEATGGTAYDTSGYDNDGALGANPANPTWLAAGSGVKDGGMQFDGSNDTLTILDSDDIDFGVDDFTICLWIKTAQATAGTILTKIASSVGYSLSMDADGKLVAKIADADGNVETTSASVINSDAWTHIAARFDRGGYCKVYVNGLLSDSTTTEDISAVEKTISNTANLTFMPDIAGSIDEVLFFDRDLYPDEIIALSDPNRKIQITEDLRGLKGDDGADSVVYYIKPIYGTALKNGTGGSSDVLKIEAHKIDGGVDSILSGGDIKLYDMDGLVVNVANGYQAGSDGYTGVLNADDINESIVISLVNPSGPYPYTDVKDTITLIDVYDGAAGDGLVGADGGYKDIRFKRADTPQVGVLSFDGVNDSVALALLLCPRIILPSDVGLKQTH